MRIRFNRLKHPCKSFRAFIISSFIKAIKKQIFSRIFQNNIIQDVIYINIKNNGFSKIGELIQSYKQKVKYYLSAECEENLNIISNNNWKLTFNESKELFVIKYNDGTETEVSPIEMQAINLDFQDDSIIDCHIENNILLSKIKEFCDFLTRINARNNFDV